MKKLLLIVTIFIFANKVLASNYNLYSPEQYAYNSKLTDEKVLFILDYSNSMKEQINGVKKIDLMLETMDKILPTINKNKWVGLRIYGHRWGVTEYDACRASKLMVPILPASAGKIKFNLSKTNPIGMTPITYSLKKAVEKDFDDFQGQKHIILLTDGGENCDESPCDWAMNLIQTRKDVKIDVIAFNIADQDDLDQLQCTALVTTGKFFSANTSAELLDSIENSLNMSKEVEAKIIVNN